MEFCRERGGVGFGVRVDAEIDVVKGADRSGRFGEVLQLVAAEMVKEEEDGSEVDAVRDRRLGDRG